MIILISDDWWRKINGDGDGGDAVVVLFLMMPMLFFLFFLVFSLCLFSLLLLSWLWSLLLLLYSRAFSTPRWREFIYDCWEKVCCTISWKDLYKPCQVIPSLNFAWQVFASPRWLGPQLFVPSNFNPAVFEGKFHRWLWQGLQGSHHDPVFDGGVSQPSRSRGQTELPLRCWWWWRSSLFKTRPWECSPE